MSLWVAEVRAGEPYVVRPSGGRRLRVTQATLGNFDHSGWVLLECKVGDQDLVKVGAVNPETAPVCPLELEFEEDENVVLSVLGQNSVHLSGYYICSYDADHGENIKQATKEISLLKDASRLPREPAYKPVLQLIVGSRIWPISGFVIWTAGIPIFAMQGIIFFCLNRRECKMEAGQNNTIIQVNEKISSKIMESNAIDGDPSLGTDHTLLGNVVQAGSHEENASQTHEDNDAAHRIIQQTEPLIPTSEDNGAAENNDEKQGNEAKQSKNVQAELHPKHICILDNGMTIEDLAKGNVNAKIASNGRKVYVRYVCKLSNGDTVNSTGQSSTCKFKLGAGEVLSGWNLGIEGMHVGGVRRLRIPPNLGYRDVGRGNIPRNSWLTYDIELLKVKRRRKERKVKRARRVAPQTSSTPC